MFKLLRDHDKNNEYKSFKKIRQAASELQSSGFILGNLMTYCFHTLPLYHEPYRNVLTFAPFAVELKRQPIFCFVLMNREGNHIQKGREKQSLPTILGCVY